MIRSWYNQSMKATKQVLVIRTDLKMRRGKEIAQGSHGSGDCLFGAGRKGNVFTGFFYFIWSAIKFYFATASRQWMRASYTKVTLQADSEIELLDVYWLCKEAGLRAALILDSGKTACGEGLKGMEIYTALGIGPNFSDEIDLITGKEGIHPLKLY